MRLLLFFHELWIRGKITQIAKSPLGKYIIIYACALHFTWAAFIAFDVSALQATPLSVFAHLSPSPTLIAATLVLVAGLAGIFLGVKRGGRIHSRMVSFLLVPQQVLLLMSAGGGLRAIYLERYADGIHRPWVFIASDQLPIILVAVLYTAVIIETARKVIVIPEARRRAMVEGAYLDE